MKGLVRIKMIDSEFQIRSMLMGTVPDKAPASIPRLGTMGVAVACCLGKASGTWCGLCKEPG